MSRRTEKNNKVPVVYILDARRHGRRDGIPGKESRLEGVRVGRFEHISHISLNMNLPGNILI